MHLPIPTCVSKGHHLHKITQRENRSNIMDEFAKKCIHDHRNPIVKLNLPAQKLFLGAKTEEEMRLVDGHQEHLKNILGHLRVEKRSSRAQAIWMPGEGIAQVTKVVKNLVKFFGFQNKNGIFLYPEEMLFLMETNRLEVSAKGSTVSIEKAYELATNVVSLSKYRIYKKLSLIGYKLVRFDQFEVKKNDLKRAREGDAENTHAHKKIRVSEENISINRENVVETKTVSKDAEHVFNIFRGMSEIMPKSGSTEASPLKPDYYIYLPTNVSKVKPDFSLFVCESNIIDQRTFSNKLPGIYATCIDDVAFYRFINVHLPMLL